MVYKMLSVIVCVLTAACRRMLPVLRLRQAIALARCWVYVLINQAFFVVDFPSPNPPMNEIIATMILINKSSLLCRKTNKNATNIKPIIIRSKL